MNSTYEYALPTDYMWFKMILETFKNQTSKNDPFGYLMHQFKIRRDDYDECYFYNQCKEHAIVLKQAFEVILDNKCQLPSFTTDIIEQVYKCEFVFGHDKNIEFWMFEEKILLIEVKDFDNILNALERLITGCKPDYFTHLDSIRLEQSKKHSFRLVGYYKNQDKLKDLRKSLINKGFISKNTKLAIFKRIFSGEEIKTRVVWISNTSELGYFIKQLNKSELVEDLKQEHWIITLKCFEDKIGNSFKRTTLHGSKIPANKNKIDSALKTLM